jgi:hypothetical protein
MAEPGAEGGGGYGVALAEVDPGLSGQVLVVFEGQQDAVFEVGVGVGRGDGQVFLPLVRLRVFRLEVCAMEAGDLEDGDQVSIRASPCRCRRRGLCNSFAGGRTDYQDHNGAILGPLENNHWMVKTPLFQPRSVDSDLILAREPDQIACCQPMPATIMASVSRHGKGVVQFARTA